MREVVQFLSDSKVYFDFSSRLLYLEDGASISLPERQSNLLYLFASKPNTVITSRQIARSELVESPVPDNYHESNSSDSDNIIAGKLMSDIRKRVPILKTLIKVETRFGYVYSGNQLMNVSDDWRPDSESIVKTDSYEPSADPILSIVDTAVSFPYEGNQPFVFISYAHKNS